MYGVQYAEAILGGDLLSVVTQTDLSATPKKQQVEEQLGKAGSIGEAAMHIQVIEEQDVYLEPQFY
ncbi:hypothetical protein E4U09_005873 [Claviceps aff. purpurea]|uniref:Uncharacterized protein n=1 Tax=Claviceps aff. purpurea TaxID=1967640 RepID=A0A9P7QCG7_9HYPO|nr:hypothetical protein E4U09_005873 [Claviceps aff. purpurea]